MDRSAYAYELIDINNNNNIHFELSTHPSSFVAMHWHDAIEIISILDGEILVETENQKMQLTAGNCVLLNANILHSTTCRAGNTSILIQIPLTYLEHYIPDIYARQFLWNPLTQNPKELTKIEQIKNILQQMLIIDDIRPDGYHLRFHGLLFELFYQLYHSFSHTIPASMLSASENKRKRLSKIFQYTEAHYRENIFLEDIASHLHLQVNYFCRFFKENTGSTYLNFLNEYRLSQVYHDLIMTDIPLKDILETHGFTNYKLFRTMFRKHFQKTPSQIRAELKKT